MVNLLEFSEIQKALCGTCARGPSPLVGDNDKNLSSAYQMVFQILSMCGGLNSLRVRGAINYKRGEKDINIYLYLFE